VDGVQTATVVGPTGSEIHTDEFGRVRVAFPWDREALGDDSSCCWLRVSQGWAGSGFGQLALPRVGQEVLVAFIDGSPDQPIVVGRVFNAVASTPYKLPEHKTRTVWRSQSSPGGDGFNELMFEDAAGEELVLMRAQKDHVREVLNDESISVSNNRSKTVAVDETETVGGNRKESISGDRVMTIGQNQRLSINHDESVLVKGSSRGKVEGAAMRVIVGDSDRITAGVERTWSKSDRHDRVGGDRREKVDGKASSTVLGAMHASVGTVYTLAAGDEVHLAAGSSCVIECPDITLRSDGGFVRIDASGVTIKGTKVFINSGGNAGSGMEPAADAPDDAQEREV
jgi:type VI secretion system secreted protein VgrG